jgi:hypothetical protein
MLAVYGDAALSKYQVKYWSKQFKWDIESTKDDPHLGRTVEVTSLQMCQARISVKAGGLLGSFFDPEDGGDMFL